MAANCITHQPTTMHRKDYDVIGAVPMCLSGGDSIRGVLFEVGGTERQSESVAFKAELVKKGFRRVELTHLTHKFDGELMANLRGRSAHLVNRNPFIELYSGRDRNLLQFLEKKESSKADSPLKIAEVKIAVQNYIRDVKGNRVNMTAVVDGIYNRLLKNIGYKGIFATYDENVRPPVFLRRYEKLVSSNGSENVKAERDAELKDLFDYVSIGAESDTVIVKEVPDIGLVAMPQEYIDPQKENFTFKEYITRGIGESTEEEISLDSRSDELIQVLLNQKNRG